MKSIFIMLLIITCAGRSVLSQNRICEWETQKITSIKVERTVPDYETMINTFHSRSDMDTILSFLKKTDFIIPDYSTTDFPEEQDDMKCVIIFQGQRDQVYLFRHSACIGKTSFLIDPEVLGDFNALIDALAKK